MAKRYLTEAGSHDLDIFLQKIPSVSISRLTVVEMRCLLGRRRRNGEIDANLEKRMVAAFDNDLAKGFLEVHPLEDRHAIRAREVLDRLTTIPLRTLDALHLAIATDIGADAIATADDIFAAAASGLQMGLEWFGERSARRRR